MIEMARALAESQGMQFRLFCSFDCTNEATGSIEIMLDGEDQELPICQEHLEWLHSPVDTEPEA